MARPVTTGETPPRLRQQRCLENLRKEGGDKVAALLPPESMGHLRTIIEVEGFSARSGKTEAIIHSLALAAKSAKRKAKAKP